MATKEKNYQIAVILTVPATTYKKALKVAGEVVESLQEDAGIGVELAMNFEYDNYGQRVLYLHPEKKPYRNNAKPSSIVPVGDGLLLKRPTLISGQRRGRIVFYRAI
jgi:hypothetical protein